MFLHKAPRQAGPMQGPEETGEGQAVLPQCYSRSTWGTERQRQHACHSAVLFSAGLRVDGRHTGPFVNDGHAPFNRVWNWFCCLAFWSNYSEPAKFTHLHGLWVPGTSIYVASEQSINFNGIIAVTFLLRVWQIFPQLYPWWYSPKSPEFPKTVCSLE